MISVGVDIGKYKIDFFYSGKHNVVDNDEKAIKKWVKSLPKASKIVMEATGKYHRLCHQILNEEGLEVMLINPFQSRNFAKSMNVICKTDKVDAKVLSIFCEKMEFKATKMITKEELEMQELSRHLDDLKSQKHALERRIDGANKFVTKSLKSAIKTLESEIKKTGEELEKVANANKEIEAKSQLLQTIPGIGKQTALMLLSTIRELGSLTKNEIVALSGLAPRNNDSGTMRGKRYVHGGRVDVRSKLFMPILGAATRHNKKLVEFYHKLVKNGKQKKVAITACMRKMIVWANAILATKQPWNLAISS